MRATSTFDKHIEVITKKASNLIRSRYGLWFLGLLSFVESALLIPIVTDPFMVAYILVHRARSFAAVVVTTLSSIFGGFIAYITAAFFIDLVLKYLSPESVQTFYEIVESFHNETFALAFLGAVTPIPFTLTALAAGAIKGSLILFLVGALAGRVLRYGLIGYLTHKFGAQALDLVKQNIKIVSFITVVAVVVYVWLKM